MQINQFSGIPQPTQELTKIFLHDSETPTCLAGRNAGDRVFDTTAGVYLDAT
jgi:hypothetical protein